MLATCTIELVQRDAYHLWYMYGDMHLTPKHSVHSVWPGKAGGGEGGDSVVAHVEGRILTIVISAADVVAPGPDPDSENAIGNESRGGDTVDCVCR